MKTNKLLTALAIVIFPFACSDDYFDKYPLDLITEGNYYKTQSDLEMALNDAYASLRDAYYSYYGVAEVTSDNLYSGQFTQDMVMLNNSTVVSDNGVLESMWENGYKVISRANLVIEHSQKIDFDEDLKNQYINEGKFLRALMYFNLVRTFGDVPLVLQDINDPAVAFSYGREPVDLVYDQIISDLTSAEALPEKFTANEDIGRATSVAAKTLLGKVYLTRHEYQKAFDKLSEVLGKRSLLGNYEDVFDASMQNNAEIIFAVLYARGMDPRLGNPFQSNFFPDEPIGNTTFLPRGNGAAVITRSLAEAFEPGDDRKNMIDSLPSVWRAPKYIIYSEKYIDKGQVDIADSGSDWIVLRYADVLLMLAEASNELNRPGDALPFVKEIRTRADLATDDAIAASQTSMRLAIEQERRIEFNNEGHRWFDLVRTGRVQAVMNDHFNTDYFSAWPDAPEIFNSEEVGLNASVEDYELIFPIPQEQIILNPDVLKQNPEY